MVFIALFAPPGAGKSNIILACLENNMKAYDLEKEGNTYYERLRSAKKLFNELNDSVVFGAADLKIKDFPKNTKKILLLPPFDIFKKRVNLRDLAVVQKSGQNPLKIYKSYEKNKKNFDMVIDNLKEKDTIRVIKNLL